MYKEEGLLDGREGVGDVGRGLKKIHPKKTRTAGNTKWPVMLYKGQALLLY